ncbi:MAG: amidohydrolase [Planctomycetaceae bacterium]|nr:amidohydrolase [Planctomycetaceae bacterium]
MDAKQILADARAIEPWLIGIRRQLHQTPELGYQEFETSATVRKHLAELGIEFDHPVATTGVVGRIVGQPGPCVALRADMDALPIQEEADIDFRSQVPGKMHACGHDCHTTMLLGAARLLAGMRERLRGTVKLLFQPAEEGGGGGKAMIDGQALENPRVERILGLHVWPELPTGVIGSRAGSFMAAVGSLQITIHGVGGHAAFPQTTIDPVLTLAKVICELQSIVSREIDPLDSAVISVTTLAAGSAFNVIPNSATARGTIRALTTERLRFIKERVKELAEHVAAANRCRAEVVWNDMDYPATVNDAHCWDVVRTVGGELFGPEQVRQVNPVMGGEDFAFYNEAGVPGCFVGVGMRNEQIGATHFVHHSKFKVDEAALPIGVALHVAFALRSLEELRR